LYAKSGPVLHIDQRAEPNLPAEFPLKIAPAPALIPVESGLRAEQDPPRRIVQRTDLQQSAVIPEVEMRDNGAILAAQPFVTETADANDNLFEEHGGLKEISKSTALKAAIVKNVAPSAPQRDRRLGAVPGLEVASTPLKMIASPPAIENVDRQFDGSPEPEIEQVAQSEAAIQKGIAAKIVGDAAKRPMHIDEQDDADNFGLLLGKLV
jgi:hypothetical protein